METIDKVVEGSLAARKATLEKLFSLAKKSGNVILFLIFASVVAVSAFILGSKIKEKEDDKFMKHFHI
jgi:hypothetical protein